MERLTREDFDKWITPMEALAILRAAFGADSYTNPRDTMLAALTAGMVLGVAGRTSRHNGREKRELEPIPPKAWENIRPSDDVWTTSHTTYGEQSTSRAYGHTTIAVSAFEVRFPPDAVRKLVPKSSMPPVPPPPTATWESLRSRPRPAPQETAPKPSIPEPPKSKGGAPRKPWWDALWVEMCMLIYRGDLKPGESKQVDIENAMADWVSQQSEADASERTIRDAAKRLFEAFMKEGKN
jgi:hypothetical protein